MAYTSKFSESLPVVDVAKLDSRERVEAIPTRSQRFLARLQAQKDIVCKKTYQLHKKTVAKLKMAKDNLEAGFKVSETQQGIDKLPRPDSRPWAHTSHPNMFTSPPRSTCCVCRRRFPPREVITLDRSQTRTCSHTWCIRCFNGRYLEWALRHSPHWPPRCCKYNVVPHEFIQQNRDVLHPILYEQVVLRAVPLEDRVYCCYCGIFLLASHPDEMPMPGHSNLLSCDGCRMSKKSFLTCRTCRGPAHANSGEGCGTMEKVFEDQSGSYLRHGARRIEQQHPMLHGIRCRLNAMRCRLNSFCKS